MTPKDMPIPPIAEPAAADVVYVCQQHPNTAIVSLKGGLHADKFDHGHHPTGMPIAPLALCNGVIVGYVRGDELPGLIEMANELGRFRDLTRSEEAALSRAEKLVERSGQRGWE